MHYCIIALYTCVNPLNVQCCSTSWGAPDGPASRGRIGLEGTVEIPNKLKGTVKGLTSQVNLAEITSQLLNIGAVRRRNNQSRAKRGEG